MLKNTLTALLLITPIVTVAQTETTHSPTVIEHDNQATVVFSQTQLDELLARDSNKCKNQCFDYKHGRFYDKPGYTTVSARGHYYCTKC